MCGANNLPGDLLHWYGDDTVFDWFPLMRVKCGLVVLFPFSLCGGSRESKAVVVPVRLRAVLVEGRDFMSFQGARLERNNKHP